MNSRTINRKFCIAPMMGYTTPYARSLYRILSKKSFLFSEMIPTKTMIYSKNRENIILNKNHNPIALQVGGSDLEDLKICSKIAYDLKYDEINLNVGCPSKAVQKGSFGACLMKDKSLVRQCLEVMHSNHNIEVSMKCRIGLGNKLDYEFFEEFIDEVIKSGVKVIYVHARNAILNGVSPKANRNIPPLEYNFVKKIKSRYPDITFILNGGINDLEYGLNLTKNFDGIMIGRLIQNNPFCLKYVDNLFYNDNKKNIVNEDTIQEYFNLIRPKLGEESIFRLLSPLLKIFFGIPNTKQFKFEINNNMQKNRIDYLEKIFLKFVKSQNLLIN